MPRVSICVPAYENPEGITRLLRSAARQTLQDYEVIITDDSAGDGVEQAAAAAESFLQGKIRYYRNREHGGAVQNWNRAIDLAQGEFVHLLHHDDWYSGDLSLEKMVRMLTEHLSADIAFTGTWQVELDRMQDRTDPDASADCRKARAISEEQERLLKDDCRNLFLGNSIGAPSAVLVRRKAIPDHTSGYDTNLTWLVDSEFYLQILKKNPEYVYTREPLISIGLSGTQLTQQVGTDPEILRREYGYVYEKHDLCGIKACRQHLAAVMVRTKTPYSSFKREWKISRSDYLRAVIGQKKAALERIADTAEYLYGKWAGKLQEYFGRPASVLFYLGLLIEIGIVIIDKSSIMNPWEGQLFRVTFLLFFAKVAVTRYTPRERGWLLFYMVLGFISWRITGRNEIMRITIFIAAMAHMNIPRIMKTTFWTSLGGCLALVILSLTGTLGSVKLTQDFGNGIETRYCLGLGHPNALHCMTMMLLLLFMYLYDRNLKLYMYAALFAANSCLYYLTKSNTAFLISSAGIVLAVMMHSREKIRFGNFIYLLGEAGFAAGLVFSVIAAIFNPSKYPLLQKIDNFLTGRAASLWDTTFHEGTLSTWYWFSSRLNQTFFDLGWIRVIYWYGVIPGVICLAIVYKLLRHLRITKDAAAWSLLILCCIYTVPEAHLISNYLARNYIFMLGAMYIPALIGDRETEEYSGRLQ